MRQSLFSEYLSTPRYTRYLSSTSNNKKRAEKLYNGNIRLSQAFHPILSQFEIVLRNSISNALTIYFTDPDWIINQKRGFMSHATLRQSNYRMRATVQNAENRLSRVRTPVSSGMIISDMTFGFWTAIFLSHHYSLVAGRPIQAFAYKPAVEDRASIHIKLEKIRSFRNRINHCEPICFNGNNINCDYAEDVRDTIFNLVSWIEPDLLPFFKKIDNVQSKINNIMSI